MSSSSSSPPSSSPHVIESSSDSLEIEAVSSCLGGMFPIDVKAYRALEVMKSYHSSDSIMTEKLLRLVRKRYSILDNYEMYVAKEGCEATAQKERAGVIEEEPAMGRAPHPRSMKDLCETHARAKGELFQTLRMGNLAKGEPNTSFQACLLTLMNASHFWSDGAIVIEYKWGVLSSGLAKQLYRAPSEVLINQVVKSLVWLGVLPCL
ncbi:hypothetical protein GW17_00043178 [Ensete ventricosum]|nr:hypothetical protein GW17_00043178 [Ensete ventricosum]